MLPVEIVAMAPKHIMLLPRTARELLTDPQVIRVIEDKSFRKFIMQAYGALVWTHMGRKDDSACYCPDDPAYRLAFNPGFWVQALEEIAEKLGYQNHSGVLKRIRKIGRAYERFADVDFGFREEKIV